MDGDSTTVEMLPLASADDATAVSAYDAPRAIDDAPDDNDPDINSSRDELIKVAPKERGDVVVPGVAADATAQESDHDYWPREDKAGVTAESALQALTAAAAAAATPLVSYEEASSNQPFLRLGQLIALTTPWLAYSIYWFVILIVTIPSQVLDIAGEANTGYAVLVIFLCGGFANLFFSIGFGWLADRLYTPPRMGGRRFSLMFIFSSLMVPVTIAMAAATSVADLAVTYTLLCVLSVGFTTPFNGLVADIVNSAQRGRVSAFLGACNTVGYVLGAVFGLFYSYMGNYIAYAILSVLFLLSNLVAYAFIKEAPFTRDDLAKIRKRDQETRDLKLAKGGPAVLYPFRWLHAAILHPLLEPLITNRDFFWVFLTRFFMELGLYTVQEFLQYWLAACVALPEFNGATLSSSTAVSLVLLPMLVIGTVSALVSGYLSDRWGRRRRIFIYIAITLKVSMCIALIFIQNLFIGIAVGVVFGIGLGMYTAVDFSMVLDVLPSNVDAARDVALWHLALVLPQIFATPLAGVILDAVQPIGQAEGIQCLGYTVIWALTAFYFLLSALFIGPYFVKKIK